MRNPTLYLFVWAFHPMVLATLAIKRLSCHNYVTKSLICHVKNNLITGYYKKPLLCIVPIFSYASPKGAIVVGQNWSWQLEILILYGPRVCRYRARPRDGGGGPRADAESTTNDAKNNLMSLSLTRPNTLSYLAGTLVYFYFSTYTKRTGKVICKGRRHAGTHS